jgi:hypothetical protein
LLKQAIKSNEKVVSIWGRVLISVMKIAEWSTWRERVNKVEFLTADCARHWVVRDDGTRGIADGRRLDARELQTVARLRIVGDDKKALFEQLAEHAVPNLHCLVVEGVSVGETTALCKAFRMQQQLRQVAVTLYDIELVSQDRVSAQLFDTLSMLNVTALRLSTRGFNIGSIPLRICKNLKKMSSLLSLECVHSTIDTLYMFCLKFHCPTLKELVVSVDRPDVERTELVSTSLSLLIATLKRSTNLEFLGLDVGVALEAAQWMTLIDEGWLLEVQISVNLGCLRQLFAFSQP